MSSLALHLHAYSRRDGPAAMLSSVFTGMGLHDRDSLADGSPPGPSLLRLYLEISLGESSNSREALWGSRTGLTAGFVADHSNRPIE